MKNEKRAFVLLFTFLFSVIQGAAEERIELKKFEELFSFLPDDLALPQLSQVAGETIFEMGNFLAGNPSQELSVDQVGSVFDYLNQLNFINDKRIYLLEKDIPVEIQFPTLENMCKIKKLLMTATAEERMSRVSWCRTIKEKLSQLNSEFEAVYKAIDEICFLAKTTQCFSSKCKKNEKNRSAEKERIHK